MDNVYLTREQQDFVSENHNLIYSFANKNNISIEDYYDTLAIALCNAVAKFDSLKGFSFSTFAYTVMKNAMNMEYRKENKQSSIPNNCLVSLDNIVNVEKNDNEEFNFHEVITNDIETTEDKFYNKDFLEDIKNILNKRELFIVNMLLLGYSQVEIANKLNCTRQNINKKFSDIKKKLKESYYNIK